MFMHGLCKSMSDDKCYDIILRVVLLLLPGESVACVRIPHVLVYMVVMTHTH